MVAERPRWFRRALHRVVVLTALLITALAAEAAEVPYERLPGSKALAVSPTSPDTVRGLAHSEPHDLAASARARERCQARAAPGEVCELVRLNTEHITTGAEIRQRVPRQPHPLFLWRFEGRGSVLYLAGSIHILKPSLYPLPRAVEAAFQRADYLVLEVDVASMSPREIQQRTLAHALLPEGRTLEQVLPAPLYAELGRHLASYGMTPEMMAPAKPAMVMNQLVVSRLMALGYEPDSGLENHFLTRRTDQRILELESLEDQLELLFGQPLETQIELLDETLEVADDIEPLLVDMLLAWLSGDDAAFIEAFRAQSGDSERSRAFTRALLEDRNHTMAAAIRTLLEGAPDQQRTYFVLVGAAHLVGEEGIVPLLARHGHQGRRLMSDDTLPAVGESAPEREAATTEAP